MRKSRFYSEFEVSPQSCVRLGEPLDLSESQMFHLTNGETEVCPSKRLGG